MTLKGRVFVLGARNHEDRRHPVEITVEVPQLFTIMSLDVYLQGPEREVEKICPCCDRSYIEKEREELFSANITHNAKGEAQPPAQNL